MKKIITLILLLFSKNMIQATLSIEQQQEVGQEIEKIDIKTETTKFENSKHLFDILTEKAKLQINEPDKYKQWHKTKLFMTYTDQKIQNKIKNAFKSLKETYKKEQPAQPQRPRVKTSLESAQTKQAFLNYLKEVKERFKNSLSSEDKYKKYIILNELKKEADKKEEEIDLLKDLEKFKKENKYTATSVKELLETFIEQVGTYYLGQAIFLPGPQAKQQGSRVVEQLQKLLFSAQNQIIKELKPGGPWDNGEITKASKETTQQDPTLNLLIQKENLNNPVIVQTIKKLIQD